MTKTFCDWCGTELRGTDHFEDPFSLDGEVCEACFDLARRTFSGKHVIQVDVRREGGIQESQYRSAKRIQ